jgi:hypothetical protein
MECEFSAKLLVVFAAFSIPKLMGRGRPGNDTLVAISTPASPSFPIAYEVELKLTLPGLTLYSHVLILCAVRRRKRREATTCKVALRP